MGDASPTAALAYRPDVLLGDVFGCRSFGIGGDSDDGDCDYDEGSAIEFISLSNCSNSVVAEMNTWMDLLEASSTPPQPQQQKPVENAWWSSSGDDSQNPLYDEVENTKKKKRKKTTTPKVPHSLFFDSCQPLPLPLPIPKRRPMKHYHNPIATSDGNEQEQKQNAALGVYGTFPEFRFSNQRITHFLFDVFPSPSSVRISTNAAGRRSNFVFPERDPIKDENEQNRNEEERNAASTRRLKRKTTEEERRRRGGGGGGSVRATPCIQKGTLMKDRRETSLLSSFLLGHDSFPSVTIVRQNENDHHASTVSCRENYSSCVLCGEDIGKCTVDFCRMPVTPCDSAEHVMCISCFWVYTFIDKDYQSPYSCVCPGCDNKTTRMTLGPSYAALCKRLSRHGMPCSDLIDRVASYLT